MGMLDEIKSEAMQSGAILGGILAFVVLFFMWSISIWLIVFVVVLVGGGMIVWQNRHLF